jgi:serine/threonine protein kinase
MPLDATILVPSPDGGDTEPTTPLLDGRYWLTALLGQGSSAAVYRGTDRVLRRPVAVKIFHSPATEPTAAARQRAEMLFLAQLNHPNLVSMYDARMITVTAATGAVNGAQHSYLVMEFVDGVSLAQRLSGTAMTLDEAATVGIAVANALAAVHHLDLVHRDVKPANILLPVTGGAKLTDFGIARLLNSAHLTITAEVVGTPLYLSPEQAAGREVGPGTDIYSLGLVLLECVTGTTEFPGAPVHSAIARTMRDPKVPNNLPAPWPDLLRSMTGSDPEERPAADAVASTLTSYLQERERSRTAATITTTPAPAKGAIPVGSIPIPGQHQSLPGEWSAAAPAIPRLMRGLPVISCGLALALMSMVIALTATGHADHPAGPTTTYRTITRTVPARSVAATSTPATTNPVAIDRAQWNVAPTVTIVRTETATETTTTTTTTSASTTPSTTTSESILASSTTSEFTTAPTTISEFTMPVTTTEAATLTTSGAVSTGSATPDIAPAARA